MKTKRVPTPPAAEKVARELGRKGLRLTRQRQVVLEVIRATGGHPDAQEIYLLARKRLPRISLGTVYRTLGILCDAGLVRELHLDRAQGRYEEHHAPHHHVVCRVCGAIADIPQSAFPDLRKRAGRFTDFVIDAERLEFHGRCARCRRETRKAQG